MALISGWPTVFHVTHNKAGSQWVYQVLDACAPGRVVPPLAELRQVLEGPIRPGGIYPAIYLSRESLLGLPLPTPSACVTVIRDLRDTWVSFYFDLRYRHPHFNTPATLARIETLRSLDETQGLRYVLHTVLPHVARVQLSWVGSGVPLVRYEELVADPGTAFRRLLAACGLGITDAQLRAILAGADFRARSGRPRGVEDRTSYYRKGIVGDWRNHLDRELLDEFKSLFDEVLVETGYERDRDWGGGLTRSVAGRERHGRSPRSLACWCGSSRLEPFAPSHRRCLRCGTLVGVAAVSAETLPALYGERFWTDLSSHHRGVGAGPMDSGRAWRGAPLEERVTADLSHPAVLERLEVLARFASPGARILDAAAGPGALLLLLRAASFAAEGLEPSPWAATRVAHVSGAPVGVGRVGDTAGPWAAISLVDTLGRDPDPLGLLRDCRDRLAPGGFVLVDEPFRRRGGAFAKPPRLSSATLHLLDPMKRPWVFDGNALVDLLSAAGFGWTLESGESLVVAASGPIEPVSHGWPETPSGRLVRALLEQRDRLSLLAERSRDDRALALREVERAIANAGDPLVTDMIRFGVGWHAVETWDGSAFRWAASEAELVVSRPTGRPRRLVVDIEPGPGVGSNAFDLEAVDGQGWVLDRVAVPAARATVELGVALPPSTQSVVRLRVAGPCGRPTPGDARVLDFRVFALGWQ